GVWWGGILGGWCGMAVMVFWVAARSFSLVIGCPANSSKSPGGPACMCIVLRGKKWKRLEYGDSTSCGPHWATGMTGTPVVKATRAAPVLPVIGQRFRSLVIVPSG